jgi:predicted MPP superfamily phosphohydrolase
MLAATIFAAVVVAVAAYSFSETYRVEVKAYTFTSPDVPPAFDGARVVLLTDIHRSFFFSDERVASLVDRTNAMRPDLIVLGGDYVYGSKDYEAAAFAELARLEAPLGTFAVLGNHDYEHPGGGVNDPAPAIAAAARARIPLLDNTGVWIEKSGQRFRLAGVSDLQQGHPYAASAVGDALASDLVVLVSHEPDFAEDLQPGVADLMLSGHTHGGQVTFFGLWAPIVGSKYGQKYRTGMVTTAATTVIVSNGVGTIFPPLRFFARPQIVVVTLKKAD